MIIQFSKNFEKQLIKQPTQVKNQFYNRIELLKYNPLDPILKNYSLKGRYSIYKSIDITGDIRALYYEKGDTLIIFALIGSHSQLYG